MARHLEFNEGKACDAVIRVLEARADHRRIDLRSPEREGHASPIELTCTIGEVLFAIEHTGIEPFAGHLKMDAEAEKHIRPIEAMLAGKLPPAETFELNMPAGATQGMLLKEVRRIQEALAAWIVETAPKLPIARYSEYLTSIQKAQPAGVPFEVSLYRFQTLIPPPRFQIKHIVSNLDQARELRVQKACIDKFPKLAAWRQTGARTVLVLEENDIFLTNAQNVYEALAKVEQEFSNRPDEIYLVGTMTESFWFVHALRVDDQGYYELSRAGKGMTEFNPATLADLTGR
jgi:hypothetical protein